MKPYFAAGQNAKDFRKVWLDEEEKDGYAVGIDLGKINKISIYQKYILI